MERTLEGIAHRKFFFSQPFLGNLLLLTFVFFSETPEGHSCGLVKTLSILAILSSKRREPLSDLIDIIRRSANHSTSNQTNKGDKIEKSKAGKRSLSMTMTFSNFYFKVIVSGKWHVDMKLTPQEAYRCVRDLKSLRQNMQIGYDIGIVLYDTPIRREIHIQTDAGRLLRPLFIANRFFWGFQDACTELREILQSRDPGYALLESGFIEYVGADEEEALLVAENLAEFQKMNPEEQMSRTHIEIHGVTILGLCALDVPFSPHSQAPRVSYQR